MRRDPSNEAARQARAAAWAVIAGAIWPGDEDGENRLLNALTDGEMEWAGRAIDGIVEELLREDGRAGRASGVVHLFHDGRAAVYLDSLGGFADGERVEVAVRPAARDAPCPHEAAEDVIVGYPRRCVDCGEAV